MSSQNDSDRDPAGDLVTDTPTPEPGIPAPPSDPPTDGGIDATALDDVTPADGVADLVPADDIDTADDIDEAGGGRTWSSSTYVPPPSPAYAAQPSSVAPRAPRPSHAPTVNPQERPTPPVEPGRRAAPTTAPVGSTRPTDAQGPTDAAQSHRQGWQLLAAGLALVIMAGAVTIAAMVSGGGHDRYVFGEVTAVVGDAEVKTDGADADPRPLEEGDRVVAGWVVEADGDAGATVELAGGGVIRMDSGARAEFVDLAEDAAGERAETAQPAVRLDRGRFWLNPGGTATDELGLQVTVPSGVVATTGNPVALDCTTPCTIEAPAGGATLTTDDGARMSPAANEQVTFHAHSDLDLAVLDAPSEWAQQNLDADGEEGLPEPRADDTPGITATAVLEGAYAMALEVVGPPGGDPIPTALQYPQGETYTLELTADGGACEAVPCIVPVTAVDGASGTADLTGDTVELTFKQPIDCYDETYTSVILPGIGTTTVTATLEVGDVVYNGERWQVRTFEGTGTVAANLATPCNGGDVLGTSTSAITIAGS